MEFLKKYRKLIDLMILFSIIFLGTLLVKNYFRPFISMAIIFFVSNPLYKLFLRFNIPSKISGALAILFINLFFVVIVIYLGNSIYDLLRNIYESNVKYIDDIISYMKLLLKNINMDYLPSGILTLFNKGNITDKALSTGNEVIAYFIGNICAFFLLIDKESINGLVKAIFPMDMIFKIYREKDSIKRMIVVQAVLVGISIMEIIIGFSIFRVPRPLFLGVLCGILDILPYVGTIIVFIPIIIYNILLREYIRAFGLIILFILIQIIREILEAKFLSDKLELHPLLILLSIYIGVKIFGFLGIMIGPMYGILAKGIIYD